MMATTTIRVPTSLTELLDTRPDTREMISANLNLAHACILAQDGLATEVEQALTQALRHDTPGSTTIAECVRAELARASGSTAEAWSKAVSLLEKDRTDVIAALYLRFLFQWRSATDTASVEKSEIPEELIPPVLAVATDAGGSEAEPAPEAGPASVSVPDQDSVASVDQPSVSSVVSQADSVVQDSVVEPEEVPTPAEEPKSAADMEEPSAPEPEETENPNTAPVEPHSEAAGSNPSQSALPEEDINFEWQSEEPKAEIQPAGSEEQSASTSPESQLADVESSVASLEAPENTVKATSDFQGGWVRIAEDESLRFLRIVNADGSLQQVENHPVDIPSLEYASITLPAHLLGQLGFGYMKHSAFEGTHGVVHAWQSTKCYAVMVSQAGATAPALAARATRAMEENR